MATQQVVKIVNGFPTLQAGALRHSVQLQTQTITGAFDDSGVQQTVWTTVATVMAAIVTSGVKAPDESLKAGQIGSQFFIEVVFYYAGYPGLTPNMRVIGDNNNARYLIQTAENVLELNVIWVARCVALGANT